MKYKCYCSVCQKEFEYDMSPEEARLMLSVCKFPTTKDGRLKLACDDCHPMVYSKPLTSPPPRC